MTYKQTEHGLLRKRERILAGISLLERDLREMRGDLITLDKTLALFGHENLTLKGPSPYQRLFKRNQLSRLLRGIARERPDLTKNADIAREVVCRMEWNESCERLEYMVYRRVKEARRVRRG